MKEWRQPLWLGVLDIEKAFDTVEHSALWQALERQGVDIAYIHLLQQLYTDQKAYVRVAVDSRTFDLGRGVNQGDPLSALLFLLVMESCMQLLKDKYDKGGKDELQ